jgi:single-strand DNA-binding protein
MKGTVNKVIILGRLGNDPDFKQSAGGMAVVRLSIATNDSYKDKATGQYVEQTDWHRVVFFGKQAEVISQYCAKGTMLYVEGKLKTSKYKDKDGVEKYSTDIIGDQFQFIGGGVAKEQKVNDNANDYAKAKGRDAPRHGGDADNFSDDDIPF